MVTQRNLLDRLKLLTPNRMLDDRRWIFWIYCKTIIFKKKLYIAPILIPIDTLISTVS